MMRGDVVTVAAKGAYTGKPRPALVVQSDLFAEHASIVIVLITSELRDMPLYRITVEPSAGNGLDKPSQVMVDKIQAVPRENIGQVVGRLDDETMLTVNRAMAVFYGIVS
jgi:mRNA interferase MazF